MRRADALVTILLMAILALAVYGLFRPPVKVPHITCAGYADFHNFERRGDTLFYSTQLACTDSTI